MEATAFGTLLALGGSSFIVLAVNGLLRFIGTAAATSFKKNGEWGFKAGTKGKERNT